MRVEPTLSTSRARRRTGSRTALRALHALLFIVERLLLRGARYRLLLVALGIAGLSIAGGLTVYVVEPGAEFAELVWWAFLRLSDPGYLGDDTGALRRSVSAVLTVLGYVAFLGALVAIMTQWLNQTIDQLQQGLTPIVARHHVVVLGLTNRTPHIVRAFLSSTARVERFLSRLGARRNQSRIVLLLEDGGPEAFHALRERVGPVFRDPDVILRTGSTLRRDHVARVDFRHAAAVLIPADDDVAPAVSDGRVLKTLLTAAGMPTRADMDPPLVVAEVLDGRNARLARRAYAGPLEVVQSDVIVSRLLAHALVRPGIAAVYTELLRYTEGSELYLREAPVSAPFCAWRDAAPAGIVLGVTGNSLDRPVLAPDDTRMVNRGDLLVVLAPTYEEAELVPPRLGADPRARRRTLAGRDPPQRALVLGWNHKAPALLGELARGIVKEVDLISMVAPERRSKALAPFGDASTFARQHIGDYASVDDVMALRPGTFDRIILLGSDRTETDEETDARTLLGALILGDLLSELPDRPRVIVELLDPDNAAKLPPGVDDVVLSSVLASNLLTQVALRRELLSVWEELLHLDGARLELRSSTALALRPGTTFGEASDRARDAGVILLGAAVPGEAVPLLNPDRQSLVPSDAELVVLEPGS